MITAAIAGLGWWGKTLVEAATSKGSRLVFSRAVTLDVEESSGFAARHGLTLSSSFADALLDERVDAIVLATPHAIHVEQICSAANAGKHVFSEKPLALDLASASRAVAACEHASVVLGLGTDKRFLPAVAELRRLVLAGELGKVLHAEAQYSNANSSSPVYAAWRHLPEQAPGGGLTGPGLHALDALISLFGPADEVDARLHVSKEAPAPLDSAVARLTFRSGTTATVSTVRGVPEYFRVQCIGTDGWAEVRGFDTLVRGSAASPSTLQSFDGSLAIGHLLDAFARAVAGEAPFPVSTRSMLDTVAAFEAIVRSIETGVSQYVERIHSEAGSST